MRWLILLLLLPAVAAESITLSNTVARYGNLDGEVQPYLEIGPGSILTMEIPLNENHVTLFGNSYAVERLDNAVILSRQDERLEFRRSGTRLNGLLLDGSDARVEDSHLTYIVTLPVMVRLRRGEALQLPSMLGASIRLDNLREQARQELRLYPSSPVQYNLKFTATRGQQYDIPYAVAVNKELKLGNSTDSLEVVEGENLQVERGMAFALPERILVYEGIRTTALRFRDLATGESIEAPITGIRGNAQLGNATLEIDGRVHRIKISSRDTFPLRIDLDATPKDGPVSLRLAGGHWLRLEPVSTNGATLVLGHGGETYQVRVRKSDRALSLSFPPRPYIGNGFWDGSYGLLESGATLSSDGENFSASLPTAPLELLVTLSAGLSKQITARVNEKIMATIRPEQPKATPAVEPPLPHEAQLVASVAECDGCTRDDRCVENGGILNNSYCANQTFHLQLGPGDACSENYECSNGQCDDGDCRQPGLFRILFSWFGSLFN